MDLKTATRRAKAVLGKDAAIRDNGPLAAASAEQRLAWTDEIKRLSETQPKGWRKQIRPLDAKARSYRWIVGKLNDFAGLVWISVRSAADTLDEAIEKLEKQKVEVCKRT